MLGSLRGAVGAFGTLVSALVVFLPAAANAANERALPMRFDLRLQGPVENCGTSCKTFISASGSITADSGREFARFLKGQNIKNATVVLDSDGGSVLGAIALGREIRKAAFDTTVGRTVDLKASTRDGNDIRALLSPRADCESMCAFVMLGGIQRSVPAEARVMVHQIWLGDRREDPTAATYSAEDLVLVQRDIGRLAMFTAEMGASMDLLDMSLRIPPWEPLHAMTRDEIRRTKLVTDDAADAPAATVAVSPPITAPQTAPATSGVRAQPISSQQRWSMVDRNGSASLARQHPLTVEGATIGRFDLLVTCGADNDSFELSYLERRSGSDSMALPVKLDSIKLRTNAGHAKLAIGASERQGDDELVSYAAGTVPASLVREFADKGNHSMVIETTSRGMVTIIRIGNTGARQSLPQLVAACSKPPGARADLPVRKTGGLASAQ
ncbi:MAG: hypothetical protein Q7T81_03765 [Pseudolabrys sp.]|nr:hypothetical protein [Pseudolabrys sp.]